MDRYNERLIKSKPNGTAFLPIIGACILTAGAIPLVLLSPPIGVLLLALGIFLITYTKDFLDIEYEFILTNGDIDISRIYAKKRRKVVGTLEAEKVAAMDSADSDSVKNDISIGRIKPVFYVGKGDDGKRVIIYIGEGEQKKSYVLDLDDKCIEHLKQVYKNKCRI